MPIYEYRCRKCGHEFEVMRRITQMDAQAPCPACRSRATSRKVSTFAVARGAAPDLTTDEIDPDDYTPEGGGYDDWGNDDF